jgi:hypothetical protein
MKIKIESNYPPALYRLPGGPLRVTGTPGIVPEGTTLADLEWVKPKAQPIPASRTVTVAGSKPGTSYTVTVTGLAKRCSCPSYSYRRTCKHLAQV